MKFHTKDTHKNPFRFSFLSVAVVCCITLSIVFCFIGYVDNKSIKKQYNQNKVELLMQDWESQLQIMTDISVRIVSNYEFHPKFFQNDVTKEKVLLKNLSQYKYYLPLTEEYFLYYGDDYIYRSTETTLNLDLFLRSKTTDIWEREWFRAQLISARDSFSDVHGGLETLTFSDNICVLIFFKVNNIEEKSNAVCVFMVEENALGKRFQTVGSNINGNISLYREDELIYSNLEEACASGQRGVLTAVSSDGLYTICYLPEKENNLKNGNLPFFLLLVAVDIFFVFVIANVFAKRAYDPILNLSEKYRGQTSREKKRCDNAIEEIDYMIDNILQSNLEANLQIQQKQEMLKNQLFHMLLEGRYTMNIETYLNKIEIRLPGPWFFVLTISFEEETDTTVQFLTSMQKELEQLSDAAEATFVYAVCNFPHRLINVICSVEFIEKKEELSEYILEVAESFSYEPIIGIGNGYNSFANLTVSWLESMDDINCKKKQIKKEQSREFSYDFKEVQKIFTALEIGNKDEALVALESYILQLKQSSVSMLMQQYIFADFIGEITRLGNKFSLTLSKQNVSMLLASKNLDDFETSVKNVIQDFCKGYFNMKKQFIDEEMSIVCEYINTHFMEYDMSLEKTAEDLHVSTGMVRKAVLEYTGKSYKDYLIYLRIEYAKKLLQTGDLSVAEVCSKTGYGSLSYFIKLFREITGVTPAKYKQGCAVKQ